MNPKETAKKLVESMHNCGGYKFEIEDAKLCASNAVYEIIEAIKKTSDHCTLTELQNQEVYEVIVYWRQVNAEIALIDN